MHRPALAFLAILFVCCGGGQTPTGAPGEEAPATPATEGPAAAEPAAPEAPAPAETAESKPPEEKKPVAKEIGAPASAGGSGGKPECAKLPKGTCKVTNGCAWSDANKCVDEGPGR